ncbi:chemotaxis protein CheY [Methylobacterium indicum]|uniref:Chemotaxis protein CheY n=1 Tax=Methylobacterium indicum TaxID=1775910 RepID=A0A0J6UG76_9HYPH|nr:response regulator transcription factor [Methylobacterium indicum]KMO24176.1 chemotaxis protein CheY [Methylobacterium indicum]KMO24801.1 chemotaxis protein CheY [Methylobacterium indicum]KTS29063.1 chemotaxis protein CheY [Methylobacterium indicum]KTS40197.1 chemotaxis protein CheY [Methylobacterium indicum]KTS45961.1 chemotaxis protein CheY [Methylobacterium indicum]
MADEDRLLVIVEDDDRFAATLTRSFERRGYTVVSLPGLAPLEALLAERTPAYAVVDLKLNGESGLACVKALHDHDPEILTVVLTGYASIATAVEAIKLGACHYLAKPANTDDIEAAFSKAAGDVDVSLDGRPTSIKTLEWERIHQTLVETDFNISETARRLGMHRRTLARKLDKQQVK